MVFRLPMMFESLTSKLQRIIRNISGAAKLTESNVSEALREVRVALLEADVNHNVAREFIDRVKTKALGTEVLRGVTPAQQMVKIIYDELVSLLGSEHSGLKLGGWPAVIMLVGLHGSGKTTTVGKLARMLSKQGRHPLLVACDVYRPAAIDQLVTIGQQINIPVYHERGTLDVVEIARNAIVDGKSRGRDVVILDTAGRHHIDEPLVQELVRLRDAVRPDEILLVLDAATGQEAVNVALHFDRALGITGAILTKLDGDARGGAAVSFKAVTGKPIKYIGTGEKIEDIEPFHPDRIASRILGMGDIVSLVEKAAETIRAEEAAEFEEKLRKGTITLEDLLTQIRAMRRLGSLESILSMLPGGQEALKKVDLAKQERELKHMEAIICAMTPQERRNPHILNARRRMRIAKGAGVTLAEVNTLLNRFNQMQEAFKKLSKLQKAMAKMSGMPFPGMFKR